MTRLRAAALLAIVALLAALTAYASSETPSTTGSARIAVRIEVYDTGNATVSITFSGTGSANLWITLPKFERIRVCEARGSYKLLNESIGAYFYVNSSVLLEAAGDGQYSVTLCYDFPYAVLMYENRGWFMSPLLLASPEAQLTVHVKIPFLERVTFESPRSTGTVDGYRVYNLAKTSGALIEGRVLVEFDSKQKVSSRETRDPEYNIAVEYPQLYAGIAARTLEIARRSYAVLEEMSGVRPPEVRFRFYLPEQSMGGLQALGFVRGEDVNVGGRGPIMLNLALIRYAPGYHETTVIHEMVHVFLGAAGVAANENTRWFHEGMAQYISILVAREIGVNVTDYESSLEKASRTALQVVSGAPGRYLERWPSSEEDAGLAYALSYYVLSNISSRYGGEAYIAKLFSALKKRGKVDSTRSIVLAMSEAAGENLAPLFRHWGFQGVTDWSGPSAARDASEGTTFPGSADDGLAAVLTLLGLAIGFAAYLVDQRVRRELEVYREKWRIEAATQSSPRG